MRQVREHTIPRKPTPCAVLVGLPDDLAATAAESLDESGLKVLRVAHVAAAAERIPVVMPQLVLCLSTLPSNEVETITERCVAVGADLIKVDPDGDKRALGVMLRDAANMALIRGLRRGG